MFSHKREIKVFRCPECRAKDEKSDVVESAKNKEENNDINPSYVANEWVDVSVNKPSHYRADDVYETIRVIEAWGLNYNLGNTIKYISRAGRKDPAKHKEDLMKARWYLDREISKL